MLSAYDRWLTRTPYDAPEPDVEIRYQVVAILSRTPDGRMADWCDVDGTTHRTPKTAEASLAYYRSDLSPEEAADLAVIEVEAPVEPEPRGRYAA